MRERLMSILEDIRPDVDFENETGLVSDGILESFDIVSIVSGISDEFDIMISPMDLVPQNFNSADAILKLIERLDEE